MQFQFPRLTPTVKKLLIVIGVAFVVTAVLQNVFDLSVFQWLALDVGFMNHLQALDAEAPAWPVFLRLAWQPLTYWLMWPPVPASFLSAALTLLMIYFFNSPFEESYGPKRMLQICAVGILAGGLGSMAVATVLPGQMPVYGGGVIVDAVIGAFPILFRGRKLYLIPFPFAIQPWGFVGLALGLVALNAVLAQDLYVFLSGAFAMGGGMGFAKWMTRPRGRKPDLGLKKKRRRGGPDLKVLKGGADDDEPPRWLN